MCNPGLKCHINRMSLSIDIFGKAIKTKKKKIEKINLNFMVFKQNMSIIYIISTSVVSC